MVKTMQTQKAALFLSDNGLINCPFRLRDALLWSNNQVFGAITAAISQDTPLFDTNSDTNASVFVKYLSIYLGKKVCKTLLYVKRGTKLF